MKQAQFVKELKKLLSKRGHDYVAQIDYVYCPSSPNKAKMRYSIYSEDDRISWAALGVKTPQAAIAALKKRLKEIDESPQPNPSTNRPYQTKWWAGTLSESLLKVRRELQRATRTTT